MCAPLRRREPRTYAMVAHCARDGGARPPQLARVPSRGANGALMTSASGPCRAPRRPTRKLSRKGREKRITAQGKKQKKQGKMLGDQGISGVSYQKWWGFLSIRVFDCI